MLTKLEVATQLIGLLNSPTNSGRVGELLADDVVFRSTAPDVRGRSEVANALFKQDGGLISKITWRQPTEEEDAIVISGRAPSDSPKLGYLSVLRFKDNRVALIEQQDLRDRQMAGSVARLTQPEPFVKMSQDLKELVNNARDHNPILIAAVSEDGQPILSFRGSIHAYSDDQLAFWLRNPEGELIDAIRKNPRVSLMYRDNKRRAMFQFRGRAFVAKNELDRERAFAGIPLAEQRHDFARIGNAVIVDIDWIEGFFNAEPGRTMVAQRRTR